MTISLALAVALAVPLIIVRIHAEERLLLHDQAYRAYAQRVRWRLIPGLW